MSTQEVYILGGYNLRVKYMCHLQSACMIVFEMQTVAKTEKLLYTRAFRLEA